MTHDVKTQLFDPPSGKVRGLVMVFLPLKGKAVRLAHATLTTDGPAEVSLSVPTSRLSGDQIQQVITALQAFRDELQAHEAKA